MKIGLVCPYNMFRGGGVQEVVLALQEGAKKRGHQAYIITPRPRDYKGDPPEGMIFVGNSMAIRASRTQGDISASRDTHALSEMLERENFDILHIHEPWTPMLSLQIMRCSNAVHIGTFHAAMSERRTSRTIEKVIIPYTKSLLRYVDVFTAVSPTATNYLSTLTDREIKIIGNGIDLEKYQAPDNLNQEKPTSPKTIFYVGRLEKRKGLKHLIEAFDVLQKMDQNIKYKLIIAGDGPERPSLEQLIEDQEIPNIKFLGYISEDQKLKYLRQSNLFCSPALYGESFGIVLLEAMASGCVTVAGNNNGYSGVLTGKGQLSIVNPKDSLEFARRLSLLANDSDIRKMWRKWAIDEAKKYDYSKIIDAYIDVYEQAKKLHLKQLVQG